MRSAPALPAPRPGRAVVALHCRRWQIVHLTRGRQVAPRNARLVEQAEELLGPRVDLLGESERSAIGEGQQGDRSTLDGLPNRGQELPGSVLQDTVRSLGHCSLGHCSRGRDCRDHVLLSGAAARLVPAFPRIAESSGRASPPSLQSGFAKAPRIDSCCRESRRMPLRVGWHRARLGSHQAR
jgi:hypothetical protein